MVIICELSSPVQIVVMIMVTVVSREFNRSNAY